MKNKITFLIPYFGKLPNYFNLFLKSCEFNSEYRWVVFTDDATIRKWPNNVSRVEMTFEEVKEKIQSKFDFQIKIPEPHKLCDYKPAYGYIFEEYIRDSEYWGHCDIDIIIGNMEKFLGEILNKDYDKLFCLGHMEIYRNTYENNRTFMLPMSGEYWYKESFSSEKTTVFDESGSGKKNINEIFKAYNKKFYKKDLSMNCHIVPTRLVKVTYYEDEDIFLKEKTKDALYIYDRGNLFRLYYDRKKNKVKREDFLYMHLQLRKMKVDRKLVEQDRFKILENCFAPIKSVNFFYKNQINIDEFKSIKRHVVSFRFFEMQIKWKVNKIKKLLK